MAKKKAQKTRGGARPGAGAKPKGQRRKVSKTIYVDPVDWERWRKIAKQEGLSGVSEWLCQLANERS